MYLARFEVVEGCGGDCVIMRCVEIEGAEEARGQKEERSTNLGRHSVQGIASTVTRAGSAYAFQNASIRARSGAPSVTTKRNRATYGLPGSMAKSPSCCGTNDMYGMLGCRRIG